MGVLCAPGVGTRRRSQRISLRLLARHTKLDIRIQLKKVGGNDQYILALCGSLSEVLLPWGLLPFARTLEVRNLYRSLLGEAGRFNRLVRF